MRTSTVSLAAAILVGIPALAFAQQPPAVERKLKAVPAVAAPIAVSWMPPVALPIPRPVPPVPAPICAVPDIIAGERAGLAGVAEVVLPAPAPAAPKPVPGKPPLRVITGVVSGVAGGACAKARAGIPTRRAAARETVEVRNAWSQGGESGSGIPFGYNRVLCSGATPILLLYHKSLCLS